MRWLAARRRPRSARARAARRSWSAPVRACAVAVGLLAASVGCKDEAPALPRGPEPMRAPPGAKPASTRAPASEQAPAADERPTTGAATEPGRPPADPEIERALTQIGESGLRFVDPASDPGDEPTEYSAEEFASMLRTKWDWLGYDLTELDPWLDGIATRSFKTNLPYQVILGDGRIEPLRPWLDAQLAAPVPAPSP